MPVNALAVDANVLVAAMMGGRTRDLMVRVRRAGIDLVSTEETFQEVEAHLPELAEAAGARVEQFKLALWSMPVERSAREAYQGMMGRALEMMKGRDLEDAPIVALSLSRGIPVWSNDRDLAGLKGTQRLTTREVAALILPSW